MDVSERLTVDDLDRGDYLAASHRHRYALAAELCRGLRVADVGCGIGYGSATVGDAATSVVGVDVDAATITAAAREFGGGAVRFEAADALDWLRRAVPAELDVVVMFEALEHVPDPDAVLAQLARLATAGVRLVVSVPNSRPFGEENEFHTTDYDFDTARRAFDGFEDVQWVYQHLAEGSVLLPASVTEAAPAAATLLGLGQAEPEYANTFLALVGFGDDATAASTRLQHVATPAHNRYMLGLERSNTEFFRTNRQLAREAYGKHDAAAATTIVWYDEKLQELETRAWILREEKLQAEAKYEQLKRWTDAGRYHAVDRAIELAQRAPGARPAAHRLRAALRRLRPRG